MWLLFGIRVAHELDPIAIPKGRSEEKVQMAKAKPVPRTDTEIRKLVLEYFYNRNKTAKSARSDKTGSHVKISVANRELKATHALSQSDVRRNLTYLISEGWIDEKPITKSFPLPSGALVPQETMFYIISAAGIDKIEGPGEFTMPKFDGIKIEATGQNIITVGDGNQVNARFGALANALADLKTQIKASNKVTEAEKMAAVADIDTIQSQLAKPEPSGPVIATVWPLVQKVATVAGMIANASKVGEMLSPFLLGSG